MDSRAGCRKDKKESNKYKRKNQRISPGAAFTIAADKLLGEGFWPSWNAWRKEQIRKNKEPKIEEFIEEWIARFRKKKQEM